MAKFSVTHTYHLLKWSSKLVAFLFIFTIAFGLTNLVDLPGDAAAQSRDQRVFLPLAASSYRSGEPILLGIYSRGDLNSQDGINTNFKSLDTWAGKGNSIVGFYLDFQNFHPVYNVRVPLELLWDNGYTAFVNLMTSRTAGEIAQGVEDGNIQTMAAAFANWMALAQQEGQERFVFLAPFPEANITNGNSYGGDPTSFIAAYRRVQDIFASEFAKANVPFDSISWVFAPNGVDEPGIPAFEAFYPGQDRVDIVAFSSYNWGYCVDWEYDRWQLGPELYLPFVQRMNNLAPGKPVFIAQTASTSEYPYPNNFSYAQKSQWFVDVYAYLAGMDSVRAVIYFNIDKQCDWAFYKAGGLQYDGYREAVSSPAYEYWAPEEVAAEY